MKLHAIIDNIEGPHIARPDERPLYLWSRGELADWCRVLEARLILIEQSAAKLPR